ncbi:MAG: 2Fe-2S iron-sulfur cluster binding domain-containing protein [Alphaproteobacteria bacterium]|nr:2Fe-2S iron-sulfur cluster binding domain-containing protein [Alphaproteobacteria bacterium]
MPDVTFLFKDGSARTLRVAENTSLMRAAVENGIEEIEGACGGCIACATCHVYIHPDWADRVIAQDNEKSESEEDMLDMAYDVRETSRLGCQIIVTKALDGLIVALPGADFPSPLTEG